MLHGLATALLAVVTLASGGCDRTETGPEVAATHSDSGDPRVAPDGAPQEEPKKQEQPAVRGVPRLTGDRAKDLALVQKALVDLKTEWDHNLKLLQEILHSKRRKPDPARVAELKSKNAGYQARAEKLQELLDGLRRQKKAGGGQ